MARSNPEVALRVNQLGYKPTASKSAIVLSKISLAGRKYNIINARNQEVVLTGAVSASEGTYAKYAYTYVIEFSKLRKEGMYLVSIDDYNSPEFEIGDNVYAGIADSLLMFFKVQRCGYTNPHLHEICHKADAAYLIDGSTRIDTALDLTGGWHDAGDFVKFLSTTAYSAYTMMLAYEMNPKIYSFDTDSNNVPDVLEEVKVGLDWLLRCNYENSKLVTQVQDMRDHDVGWRMPEKDSLEYDRPGLLGAGKNLIGIYSATLAFASRLWRDKFSADDFADKCLTTAENYYSIYKFVPDIDSSTTGVYQDNSFEGKMALAAVELYKTTNRKELLEQAKAFADEAGPDYWWSYGEISDFAFYRLAEFDAKYIEFIEISLKHFTQRSKQNLFKESVDFYWGSNNTMLGVAIKSILWSKLTGKDNYKVLAGDQINYVLGENPWGISFISQAGSFSAKKLHHQISKLLDIPLPGGFAAGPVKKEILKSYKIPYEDGDEFSNFQTDEAYYRDDYVDYITNEPTIIANATGIFVFGLF